MLLYMFLAVENTNIDPAASGIACRKQSTTRKSVVKNGVSGILDEQRCIVNTVVGILWVAR